MSHTCRSNRPNVVFRHPSARGEALLSFVIALGIVTERLLAHTIPRRLRRRAAHGSAGRRALGRVGHGDVGRGEYPIDKAQELFELIASRPAVSDVELIDETAASWAASEHGDIGEVEDGLSATWRATAARTWAKTTNARARDGELQYIVPIEADNQRFALENRPAARGAGSPHLRRATAGADGRPDRAAVRAAALLLRRRPPVDATPSDRRATLADRRADRPRQPQRVLRGGDPARRARRPPRARARAGGRGRRRLQVLQRPPRSRVRRPRPAPHRRRDRGRPQGRHVLPARRRRRRDPAPATDAYGAHGGARGGSRTRQGGAARREPERRASAPCRPPREGDFALLREQADAAVYEAKRTIGSAIVVFDEISSSTSLTHPDGVRGLGELLEHGELDVAFQPIWDLERNAILGYEALARPDARFGFSGPGELFDLAESSATRICSTRSPAAARCDSRGRPARRTRCSSSTSHRSRWSATRSRARRWSRPCTPPACSRTSSCSS